MRHQTKLEERFNVITHALGIGFGILALVLLIKSYNPYTTWSLFCALVYSISIIILFTSSTLYHATINAKQKHYFRIIDHISIYLLIAGSYTPVVLLLLENSLGWSLFWAVWSIAFFGMILKLFYTGRFEVFSTLLYLVMGWLIIFDINNLIDTIGNGIWYLAAGGLAYTVGIVFYLLERMPFNHVIWHVFVLAGAIFHFLMIYWFVI